MIALDIVCLHEHMVHTHALSFGSGSRAFLPIGEGGYLDERLSIGPTPSIPSHSLRRIAQLDFRLIRSSLFAPWRG
jgi:hypothetical protein